MLAANVTRTGEFRFIQSSDWFACDVFDFGSEVVTQAILVLGFDGDHGPLVRFSFELGLGALDNSGGEYIGCDGDEHADVPADTAHDACGSHVVVVFYYIPHDDVRVDQCELLVQFHWHFLI